MSSTPDTAPPVTWKGRNSQINAPDPNAGRADNYPNKWRVEFNKQTAKCMVCARSLKGTQWCVSCVKCSKRICQDCWTGNRYNRYNEKIFEGHAQNEEGCWCRFPSSFDPKWHAASEARTERMQKMIAAERKMESPDDAQEPAMKKPKLEEEEEKKKEEEDGDDDREQSPSLRVLHPKDVARHSVSESKKRAAVEANPLDEDTKDFQADQSRKDSRMPPIEHLQGKTTVIVGAGVIGLSIARELACQAVVSGTEHEVIVVEARDSYAELASHDCAGLITKHGVPRRLGTLLNASLDAWHQLLADEEIREKVHYQPSGAVHVKHNTENAEEQTTAPPSWYSARSEEVFNVYESDVGKISTRHFADWLYQECEELGVQFRFHQEISGFEKTKQAQLQAVDISSAIEGDERYINIPCHNLIIAAGPFTPGIIRMLAFWLPDLDNWQQRWQWTRIHRAGFDSSDDVGMMLRSGTYDEGTLIASQPHANEILVATTRAGLNNSHVTPTDVRANRAVGNQPTSKSRILAKQQVVGFDEEEGTIPVVDGRSLTSTSSNQRPIIDKIPAKLLDQRHEGEDDNPLGIYLAFGFGRHGTTLAPGAATMLRRMICRDEELIGGEEAFAFPTKRV